MTARNIPCHEGFPKVSAFVTLSADKTSPQPLMERTSHFSECVNNFWLAGQTLHPGNVCSVCLRGCLYLLIYICLNTFTSFVSFQQKAGEKIVIVILPQLNQELHAGEGCNCMDLPDHVNEVPWLCSHWSIIDLFVSYLPNRHSDPEHV